MTDEEKKEYRDKLVEDCMKYNHIDYDDDKDIVETIPDNVEVIINMTKPDKTHVHNDGEKSGNEALIPLTRGMLQVHGTAYGRGIGG